jgi:type II secretory pathway pseudopilin PulG
MKQKRIFRHSAFTLMELILTMSLLVLGIVPVIRTMAAGTVADQVIERQIVALDLAQEKIEEIKDCSDWTSIGSYALERAPIDEPFSNYEWEVVIQDMDEDPENFKEITVNVYWEIKAVEQHISLSTLFTNLTPGG